MKLIAIYIGEYKLFHKQLLTFSSDYKVEYTLKGGRIFFRITHERKLPNRFFSTRPYAISECVSSVSAIIGENGSGKTMIARLLFDLGQWGKRLEGDNVAVIAETDGKIRVYTSFAKDKCHVEVVGEEFPLFVHFTADETFDTDPLPFKMFYFSPHYSTEQTDLELRNEGDTYFNISTTWLLEHPEGNSETLLPEASPLLLHDMDETIRVLNFCVAYEQQSRKALKSVEATPQNNLQGQIRGFAIPVPEGISIMPRMVVEGHVLRKMRDYVNDCRAEQSILNNENTQKVESPLTDETPPKFEDEIGEYVREMKDLLQDALQKHSDFFTRIFVTYVAEYLLDCGILGHAFPSSEIQEGSYLAALKKFIRSRGWNQAVPPEVILEFLEANPPPLNAETGKFPGRATNSLYTKDFFQCLSDLCKLGGKTHGNRVPVVIEEPGWMLFCDTRDEEVKKLLYRLVRLHGLTAVISPFLKFDILPHMSSGEMAFLSMFARLHHFVHKHTHPDDNVLIFLDETETTLHPEWQRRLVDYVIRFLEVFIPDRHYQLVFASHSPMLLSDIPAGNCCFLETHILKKRGIFQKRAICHAFPASQDANNTFGANIYDLFKDGFFLKNGAIGEFASLKIQAHLEKVAKRASRLCKKKGSRTRTDFSSDDKLTQDLIGDRVLVQYFKVLKEQGLI